VADVAELLADATGAWRRPSTEEPTVPAETS